MSLLRIIVLFVATVISSTSIFAQTSSSLTDEQRQKISNQIKTASLRAESYRGTNQAYDITSKIGLFLVALAVAVGTWKASTYKDKVPPSQLMTTNAILAAITTLATGFITQFEFPKRFAVYERQYHALEVCELALSFPIPDPDRFVTRLGTIIGWGDSTNLTELSTACSADDKGTSGAGGTKSTQTPPTTQSVSPSASGPK